jgi:hypothetical protein
MKLNTKEEAEELLKSNPNRFYVYGLHRPDKDEIFYIGKGKGCRIFAHIEEAQKGVKHNLHKQRIIRKLNFDLLYLIKFVNSEEEAFEWEKKLIARHGRDQLCNLTDGGEGVSGYQYTDEQKIEKRNSVKKFYETHDGCMKGKTHSKETKALLSKMSKGRSISQEQRKKISDAQKGEKAFWYGKKHPEETKQKMSESLRKTYLSGNHNWGGHFGEENNFYGEHHTEEVRKKLSEINKGTTHCLDISLRKIITISVEEFYKLKNIRYFATSSNVCKNWKKTGELINETRIERETIGTYVGKQIRLW